MSKSKILILVEDFNNFHCPFGINQFPGITCDTWNDKNRHKYTHICTCKEISK